MTNVNSGSMPHNLLKGVKVIEFCQVAAGPFCGMLLADYGAEVIKVEPREGDTLRQWPPHTDGFSENFLSVNRGKQSICLNLKDAADLHKARQLVLQADVLIENSRPGVMDRLGLGWNTFVEEKPALVYCSISAYGQSGPRAAEGGFDLTIQAAAGVMSVTGTETGEPVKCGVPISDFTAGLYAAFSISAMIARVRSGGKGGHIDVPMFATTLAIAALQTSQYFGTGTDPKKLGSAHPRNAPYQAYQAKNGWFAIAAGNNKLWYSVCEVIGQTQLRDDERFTSPTLRATNQAALKNLLEACFILKEVEVWLQKFNEFGVPAAPLNTYSSALMDKQAVHLQLVADAKLPNGTVTKTVGCPVWIDGSPIKVNTQAPDLGEQTEIVTKSIVNISTKDCR